MADKTVGPKHYLEAFEAHRKAVISGSPDEMELLAKRRETALALVRDGGDDAIVDLATKGSRSVGFFESDIAAGQGRPAMPAEESAKLVRRAVFKTEAAGSPAEQKLTAHPGQFFVALREAYQGAAKDEKSRAALVESLGDKTREQAGVLVRSPEHLLDVSRTRPDFAQTAVMLTSGDRPEARASKEVANHYITSLELFQEAGADGKQMGLAENARRNRQAALRDIAKDPQAIVEIGKRLKGADAKTVALVEGDLKRAAGSAELPDAQDPGVVQLRKDMLSSLGQDDVKSPVKRYAFLAKRQSEILKGQGNMGDLDVVESQMGVEFRQISSSLDHLPEAHALDKDLGKLAAKVRADEIKKHVSPAQQTPPTQDPAKGGPKRGLVRKSKEEVAAGYEEQKKTSAGYLNEIESTVETRQDKDGNTFKVTAYNEKLHALGRRYRANNMNKLQGALSGDEVKPLALPLTPFSAGGGVSKELTYFAAKNPEKALAMYKATLTMRNAISKDASIKGSEEMKLLHDEYEMGRRSLEKALLHRGMLKGDLTVKDMWKNKGKVPRKPIGKMPVGTEDQYRENYRPLLSKAGSSLPLPYRNEPRDVAEQQAPKKESILDQMGDIYKKTKLPWEIIEGSAKKAQQVLD